MRRRGARTGSIGAVAAACIALPLAACGGDHSAPSSGESADAAAVCAAGGPCPICGSDPASAAAANGTTCAPGMVCVEGGCVAACFINGAPVFVGARAPSGAPCQGCNPKASTSGWSGIDDGSRCGGDGGAMVCVAGSCVSGCAIGGQGYAAGAVNPSDPCQGCVPAMSTQEWSMVLANGASCGTSKFCFSGNCAPGCSIGGTAYPSGAHNPTAANYDCQTCLPGTNETSWTSAADGSTCPSPTTSSSGSCCGGVCVDPTSDTSNCGACGHSCTEAPTPTCAGGYCASALGSTGFTGARLAVDATNVYWTTTAAVMQAPIAGGSATTLASGQLAQAVAVDATNVYFTSSLVGAALLSVPIGGGTARTLSSTFGGNHIAVRAGYVYGTLGNAGGATGPAVGKLPTSGGTPVSLGSSPEALTGLTVDATNVYWATESAVMKAPIAGGGTTTTLVSGNGSPLTVDTNNVYYGFHGLGGSNTYGPVLELSLAGGMPTTLATGMHMIDGIAVDAANVYWADNSGSVLRVPIGGGAVTTLATKQVFGGDIAVDATHVYWITDLAVMKAPK